MPISTEIKWASSKKEGNGNSSLGFFGARLSHVRNSSRKRFGKVAVKASMASKRVLAVTPRKFRAVSSAFFASLIARLRSNSSVVLY
jgi:hypothetical protein